MGVNKADTSKMPMSEVLALLAASQFDDERVIVFATSAAVLAQRRMKEEVARKLREAKSKAEVQALARAEAQAQVKGMYDMDTGICLPFYSSFRVTHVGWTSNTEQMLTFAYDHFSILDKGSDRKEINAWDYRLIRNAEIEKKDKEKGPNGRGFVLTLQPSGSSSTISNTYRSDHRLALLSELARLRDLCISRS